MKKIISFFISLAFMLPCFCETIHFKNGKTIDAKILEKTSDSIKIDADGAALTYYFDDIDTIDGKKLESSPKQPQDNAIAGNNKKTHILEILNSEYTKAPDENDNIEVTDASTAEDILKKINYFYANHEFDKAIELAESTLKNTSDRVIIARLYFSLSSNYLEKGIDPYLKNKDVTFYNKSLDAAKKSLEVFPDNWQILGNIGAVYLNMGDWKQAVSYYTEAQKHLDSNDPHYKEIDTEIAAAEEMIKREANGITPRQP
jgi:tetratricopeptide (TPR) repeat protein